jgi:putative ABC transport system permease protein
MADARVAGWLARALPSAVRADVFEPAYRDLVIEAQTERGGGMVGRGGRRWGGLHVVRVVLLYLDCWRIALTDPHYLLHGPARPAGSGRRRGRLEEWTMFVHAVRQAAARLVREPGFTMVAAATLALGVGANVAVFAVVDAVLLRPLPYAASEELAIVNHRDVRTGITKEFIAIGDYVDIVERQTAFAAVAGYGSGRLTLYDGGEPLQVGVLSMAPGLFDVLGVHPQLGRVIGAEDARQGAAPVAMLGHRLWQERFGGDPAVVGRSVRVGLRARTIVGITPAGFQFPPSADTDVILPQTLPLTAPAERKAGWIFAVGRVAPGRTAETATADLAAISARMEREHPEQNLGSTYYAEPLRDALVGETKGALLLLLGAVGFVLLIACANVANLQLARALGRRREIAVRLALGAGRGQLTTMLLAESLVLALVAGAAGVAASYWAVRALVALVPASVQVPGLAEVRLSVPALGFALGLALVAALAFGALAAFTVRLEHAADVLVSAGRATMTRLARRATSALVVAEVALAVVLCLGAGLVLRSFAGLLAVDPGFGYANVLTAEIQLPADRYPQGEEGSAARRAFYQRTFAAIHAIPGVEEVGAGVVVPLTGNNWTVPFERADRPVAAGERPPDVGWQVASGGFFRALAIPLVSGRLFDERDEPGGPGVVIVSESIERSYFPGESAVGRQVRLGEATAEIVGVVGDIRRAGLDDSPRADMYFPFESDAGGQITLFVRHAPDAADIAASVRTAVRAVDPATAFLSLTPLAAIASESVRVTELILWLLAIFAGAALLLAAVGIYGVMAYVVRQRTREIATRMAVGATRGDIVRLVLRQGAGVAAAGIAAGLVLGLGATRFLRSALFGVSPTDPVSLGAAVLLLGGTALLAAYLPARRASAVDPARTLGQQ